MAAPFFSIVIPTRNRAHLVQHAIQSLLGQEFDDYELIVSDNCSTDNTAEVVNALGKGRARYVRPPRTLSMPDHWEFAFGQAQGRYIGYLCDDDALVPGALARAAGVLTSSTSKLVVLCSAVYYAPDWLDPKCRNLFTCPPFTGEVQEHRSEDSIRSLFRSCRVINKAPRMLNSFFERETMLSLHRDAGRIFLMCPDYSFAVMALTTVPSWLYIDEPLHVQGVFPEGIGSTQTFNRGEPAREFLREFNEDKLLQRVPLKSAVVSNYISETYLMCQERLLALAGYEIDWVQYFVSCWNDLLFLERNGVNISADREEFARVLAAQRTGIKRSVEKILNCREGEDPIVAWNLRHPLRAWARKMIDKSLFAAKLESVVRGRKGRDSAELAPTVNDGRHVFISGADAGFTNILECARFLPELPLR